MKDFIQYLLNQIVEHTDQIKIDEVEDNGVIIYQINVAQEDMGAAIGKEGRTIKSIRALVRAKAIKDGVHVRVELIDKERELAQEQQSAL